MPTMIERYFLRWWNSPLWMTWFNTAARILSMLAVLPLVLREFEPAEISVFFLFASIVTVQLMLAGSVGHTFARVVSFVLSGATFEQIIAPKIEARAERQSIPSAIDLDLLGGLSATMNRVFTLMTLIAVPTLIVFGSAALARPIQAMETPWQGWAAWAVVVAVTPLVIKSLRYTAFLQGAQQLALEQRWSAVFALGGLISGVAVLLCGGSFLELILVNQAWQAAGWWRLRWLHQKVFKTYAAPATAFRYEPRLMRAVWPVAWRSMMGTFFAIAPPVLGGLWFAQVLTGGPLAELLFGVRIMNIIGELCRAPFYSCLPLLNSLRIQGRLDSIVAIAKRGMQRSYSAFVLLFMAAPIVAHWILPAIGSRLVFPTVGFWLLLGLASLVERCASMHLNLYSTTNHIVAHWLNGTTAVVSLLVMVGLTDKLGSLAYPVGLLAGMGGWSAWVAGTYSLRSLNLNAWQFERDVFLPAVSAQAVGSIALFYWARA